MRIRASRKGIMLAAVLFLAGCEAAGTLAGGGSQSDYLVARQALETGNYDLAIRRYGRLMESMNAVSASRLQLEYAHALLRGDRFEDAINATNALISAHDGTIRASAMAVRGTARHEAARQRLAGGTTDAVTRVLLQGARDDLTTFLEQHANLDTTGSMRARLELVTADLRAAGPG